MAHVIDTTRSGRTRCRTCGDLIPKGEVFFAHEAPDPTSDAATVRIHLYHLACAAKRTPSELRTALQTCPFPVPDRKRIERLIAENEPLQKPTRLPYAERAATAKSHCGECHTLIARGALRVALHRANEGQNPTVPVTPLYFHAACVRAVLPSDLAPSLAQIRENSHGLTREDLEELSHALAPRNALPLAPSPIDEERISF